MTDLDPTRETPAPERIPLDDLAAVDGWAKKLAVTPAQIHEAVASVGPLGADVEMHLKGSHATTNADRVAGAEAAQATLSRPEWIERFGSQLMKLQPAMNAMTAAAQAVAAYPARCAVEPEDAAKAAFEGSQAL